MATHPHEIAGRYRVLEEAGRGGMGSVYRCVDERLGREVAVKQVGLQPGESVTDRARALREARSSAALNHPNVVAVYDAVADDDRVWLVMEHVPGRTLSQLLREEGPLNPDRAAHIGAQVADGLAAAHARGTVHRDVKPGNVLVTQDDRAKVADFGIARTAGDATLTRSGMLSGTPTYMAPEIARGEQPQPTSDVWALGATLFTAVEGDPPFPAHDNPLVVLNAIATEEPRVPQHAGPLTEPIRRMLDRDPGSRWSIADAAHALHRIAGSTAPPDTREETPLPAPVPAASPAAEPPAGGTPHPPGRSPRRRPGALAVAAVLVVLLVVGIIALMLLRQSPSGTAPSADRDSGTASSGETNEPDPDPTSPPATTEPPTGDGDTGSAGSRTAFVEDYYAVLPDDTRGGYAMLAPSYQADTSFEDYDGFWSTVDEVSVEDAAPAGADAVDVTLVYDGGEQEVRRIYLTPDGDTWLITGDEVIG